MDYKTKRNRILCKDLKGKVHSTDVVGLEGILELIENTQDCFYTIKECNDYKYITVETPDSQLEFRYDRCQT